MVLDGAQWCRAEYEGPEVLWRYRKCKLASVESECPTGLEDIKLPELLVKSQRGSVKQ